MTDGPEPGRLCRERVVEAALAIADEHGINAVSMHRVAKDLGVGSMTLYTYVKSKDDLMDAVAERAVVAIELPALDLAWDDRLRALAQATCVAARGHRSLPGLLMVRPPSSLAMLRPLELVLGALLEAGLSDHDAAQIAEMQWALVAGILVGTRTGVFDRSAEEPTLHRAAEDERFPNITALGHHLFEGAEETVALSMDVLVAGVRARVAS